jgi:hypothetical protein
LISGAKALLKAGRLPKHFWPDAIMTKQYLMNRTFSHTTPGNISPIELLTGNKPNLSKLITFGAVAYAHVPKDIRKKLDDTAITCRFIGYSSEATHDSNGGSAGYLLYDLKSKKTVTTSSVRFNTSLIYKIAEPVEYDLFEETNAKVPDELLPFDSSQDEIMHFDMTDLQTHHDIGIESDVESDSEGDSPNALDDLTIFDKRPLPTSMIEGDATTGNIS